MLVNATWSMMCMWVESFVLYRPRHCFASPVALCPQSLAMNSTINDMFFYNNFTSIFMEFYPSARFGTEGNFDIDRPINVQTYNMFTALFQSETEERALNTKIRQQNTHIKHTLSN